MSPDSIPQLSLGTAVLVIFLVCAGFVMLRGMTRMIVGTVVLAFSAWIGFLVWQKAPTLSVEWFGKSIGFITTGLPDHRVPRFVLPHPQDRQSRSPARLESNQDEETKSSSPIIRLAFRLLLALIPTSLICLIGATFIHHTGSIAEIRAFSEKILGINEPTPAKFSQQPQILGRSRAAGIMAQGSRSARRSLAPHAGQSHHRPIRIAARTRHRPRTGKPIPARHHCR